MTSALLNELYFGLSVFEFKQFSSCLKNMECDVNTCANVNKCCQTEEISMQNSHCQMNLDMESRKRDKNYMQVMTEELTLAKSQFLAGQL